MFISTSTLKVYRKKMKIRGNKNLLSFFAFPDYFFQIKVFIFFWWYDKKFGFNTIMFEVFLMKFFFSLSLSLNILTK